MNKQEVLKNLDLHANGIWVPLTVVSLLIILVIFTPKKHISWRKIYVTFGVIGFITWFSDSIISRLLNLTDFGNPITDGISDILSYCFIPSSLACLYLNYFNGRNRNLLAPIFIIVSLCIELSMLRVGYLRFHGWNTFFSLIIYALAYYIFLPLHAKIISKI
ncbi:MAG: hypothetical protein ACE3JK_14115 [Sporolactobacillus sp.]